MRMKEESGESTIYELAYLILPSIGEDKVGDVSAAIKKLIEKEGGEEIDGEEAFKQDLSYEMSKTVGASRYVVSDAYLGWIKFECSPENILVIKDAVEKMSEILRVLVVKAPRETHFTFAKAREALEAQEAEKEAEAVPAPAVVAEVVE